MMTQSHSEGGADLEEPRRISGLGASSAQSGCSYLEAVPRRRPRPMPDLTVFALDRLIARIESGIATPEDVDHLPKGVVQYLDAVLTLEEMSVLDQGWQVTVEDDMVVWHADR